MQLAQNQPYSKINLLWNSIQKLYFWKYVEELSVINCISLQGLILFFQLLKDILMAQNDVDGALVGGAALKEDSFDRIIHFRQ